MGWFERKKPKSGSDEDAMAEALKNPDVLKLIQRDQATLHRLLPGAENLMPLEQAVLLTPEARLAYAKQLAGLYEQQERKPFSFVDNEDAPMAGIANVQESVQTVINHLQMKQSFPARERVTDKLPGESSEYHQQFEQMMGFLMKRLDRSQPMVDQVSRLIDAVNLDHIGMAITEAIQDKDQKIMRGKLKDRAVKYLIALNKM